jgi:hypothetical protein
MAGKDRMYTPAAHVDPRLTPLLAGCVIDLRPLFRPS